MGRNWEEGICNEKSGFLFSHECFRPPSSSCGHCQKPVCDDHAHTDEARILCTTCVKKQRRRRGTNESKTYSDSADYHDHDPYFYGGFYYGMGYYESYQQQGRVDPSDFTEADAESLGVEEEADFENDMGES